MGSDDQALKKTPDNLPNNLPQANPFGAAATFNANDTKIDTNSDFFTSFGTNGRTCGHCHQPSDGWSIIPSHLQARFDASGGTDPVFRTNDGSVSPVADVSTVDARRAAYSMLLSKGLIRVGNPVLASADFTLTAVDDPYHYANTNDVSEFRRPLQSANLDFLSTVMWDGRETFRETVNPSAPGTNCLNAPFPAGTCFKPVDFDLIDQSNGATLGHAQAMVPGLSSAQQRSIVDFESGLFFGQIKDNGIGNLDTQGATGGPEAIASVTTYFGINDNFGDYGTHAPFTSEIFNLYNAWDGSADAARAQVARGQKLFNERQFTIDNVGGLNGPNDALGLPHSFSGTCGTCHDALNGGDHTIPAPLDIGLVGADRRTADLPLYTFCKKSDTSVCRTVTDPGRGLITGKFNDIGKFKGPTLRGISARAPYFHNGSAADLGEAVDFYNTRFSIGFTAAERADLVAFLASL
jgi:hypothetical protein